MEEPAQDGMFIQHLPDYVIQSEVSKMTNGEKYVCIARTVEKGIVGLAEPKAYCQLAWV